MIKNVRFFVNKNDKAYKVARLARDKFLKNDFNVVEDGDDFSLGIAIGGDGSFLRMIKENNFSDQLLYVGINAGHLGFLQEAKVNEIDKLIKVIQKENYKISELDIQNTEVKHKGGKTDIVTLNEIVVREQDLGVLKANIYLNRGRLETFLGDGLIVCTSVGSTGHNLSAGGSIVSPEFSTLQLTPINPVVNSEYRSLPHSIILSGESRIKISPENEKVLIHSDGEKNEFEGVEKITSTIGPQKIKCLHFVNHDISRRIREKLL